MKIKTLKDLKRASDDEVKTALSQVTVMEDLEEYLSWLAHDEVTTVLTTELKRYKGRPLGIHPSSACKKEVCLLKLYFECSGAKEPRRAYDAESQRIFDIGTLLHDLYQCHFKNMYPEWFKDEISLKIPKLMVRSHTDGIFDFTAVRIVLEMKSIKEGGTYGWEKVQLKPFEDNVRQAHFYMKGADVPFALIFYINKNSGKLLEHPVSFDFDLWDEIVTEVITPVVKATRDGGEVPPPTPQYGCRWCDYSWACPAYKEGGRRAKRNLPWRGSN